MAHYAKIENGIVASVIVASQEWINTQPGVFVQTSYTGSMRRNFAGIGYSYDEQRDAFIPPRPFASWILNETTCQWQPPTPKPDGMCIWNEMAQAWEPVNN